MIVSFFESVYGVIAEVNEQTAVSYSLILGMQLQFWVPCMLDGYFSGSCTLFLAVFALFFWPLWDLEEGPTSANMGAGQVQYKALVGK